MIKILFPLTFFLFPVSAFACNEESKPNLILERISNKDSSCSSFWIVIPTTFNGADLKYVVFVNENPAIRFQLQFTQDDKLMQSYSPMCIKESYLKSSKVELLYKEPVGSDGGMKLCFDEYQYKNLSQHIKG